MFTTVLVFVFRRVRIQAFVLSACFMISPSIMSAKALSEALGTYDDGAVRALVMRDPEAGRDIALRYVAREVEISPYDLGRAINSVAISYAIQGSFDEALAYFVMAYDHAEAREDLTEMAGMKVNIANAQRQQGNLVEAISNLTSAISIAQEAGIREQQITALINLGDLMAINDAHELALPLLREAMSIIEPMDNRKELEGSILLAMLHSYRALGQYDQLADAIERSEQLLGEDPTLDFQSILRYNRTKMAIRDNRLETAEQLVNECFEAVDRHNLQVEAIDCRELRVEYFLAIGDATKSRNALKDYFEFIPPEDGINRMLSQRIYHKMMSLQYELEGNPVKALENFRAANTLTNELENIRQEAELAFASAAFVDRGRDMRLDLLAAEARASELELNRQRMFLAGGSIITLLLLLALGLSIRLFSEARRQRLAVAAALDQRNILMRELRHRVGNNFQTIVSLVNAQRQKTERQQPDSENQSDTQILQDLQGRLHALNTLQRQLEECDEKYIVPAKTFITEIVNGLTTVFGGDVEAHIAIDVEELPAQTAAPMGLIVNELVSNALEHGFINNQANPQIKVQLSQTHSAMILAVEDNGSGFDTGPKPDYEKSLGLSIVEDLVQQLNGRTSVHSGDQGTRWTITIDKTKQEG